MHMECKAFFASWLNLDYFKYIKVTTSIKQYAKKLSDIVATGWLWTSDASSQLRRDHSFGRARRNTTLANCMRLFTDRCEL